MNKIITIIALLVIVTSAHAWDIDYSKYTIKRSRVAVSKLKTHRGVSFVGEVGDYASAASWWSPDTSIVVMHPGNFRTHGIRLVTPDMNGRLVCPYLPNIKAVPAYLEVYTSSSGSDYSDIPYDEHRHTIQSVGVGTFSICSGPNCDRLIKSVKIRFFTRINDSIPYQAKIGTFDYIGDCNYSEDGKTLLGLSSQSVTITPHIPTTQIPIYIKSWAGPLFTQSNNSYSEEACAITDFEIEYLLPTNEKAMRKEFAQSYKWQVADMARTTVYEANLNPVTATYAGISPTDINNDKIINSADVVSVYNYILNGENNYNGHAYVDLGLPSGTLWATCNVGAVVPEAWGDLYCYGENMPFSLGNYNCTGENYSAPISEPTLSNWKGWHYPTAAEVSELENNTTAYKAVINGNECCILTSNINGKQLVFPLPGYVDEQGYHYGDGYYWTTRSPADNSWAYLMNFSTHGWGFGLATDVSFPKYCALSLRMTCKP